MLHLDHKNMVVWRRSLDLTVHVYKITESFPNTEIYGITSQLRRAVVSIPSNIAEGASRSSGKERTRFYEIARSSLVEVDTQFEIAFRLGYCEKSNVSDFIQTLNEVFAMLSSLIKNTN